MSHCHHAERDVYAVSWLSHALGVYDITERDVYDVRFSARSFSVSRGSCYIV